MKISKKFLACIVMVSCLMLTACGGPTVSQVVRAQDGYAEGQIGTTFRTAFFDYSVDSVEYPSVYEGYTPDEDMQLVDIVVTIKNTFGEALPMFNSDFWIDWMEGDDEYYDYGIEMDSSSTIMPSEFSLANGKTCKYHIIYEVPAEITSFAVCFEEFFEDESTGDIFATFFDK